jgi:hypothetical protein
MLPAVLASPAPRMDAAEASAAAELAPSPPAAVSPDAPTRSSPVADASAAPATASSDAAAASPDVAAAPSPVAAESADAPIRSMPADAPSALAPAASIEPAKRSSCACASVTPATLSLATRSAAIVGMADLDSYFLFADSFWTKASALMNVNSRETQYDDDCITASGVTPQALATWRTPTQSGTGEPMPGCCMARISMFVSVNSRPLSSSLLGR